MATLPGKTDRYRPNDPTWRSAPFYGGFMPSIVPDQVVAKSPHYPSSVIDRTFAALGPLEPQGSTQVASVRPSWTVPNWGTANRIAAREKQKAGSLDSLLAYTKGLPDTTAMNPPVVAATNPAIPNSTVTAPIKPQSRGGLFELIFGPSKNGMGGLAGLLGGPGAGGIVGMLGAPSTPRAPRTARAPDTYTPATSVSGNTGYRNERTGVLHTSDKGHQYGSTSSGQRTDYGASPGQKTAGLKPGDRVYDSSTNSWGLK